MPEAWWFSKDLPDGSTLGATDWSLNICGAAYAEQGVAAPNVVDFGIALTGSAGIDGGLILTMLPTGHRANMSFYVNGTWYTLARVFLSLADMFGISIDFQTYLNGQKNSSSAVNTANDAQITFVWSDLFTEVFGYGFEGGILTDGDFGIRFANGLRNQNGLAIIAVTEPSAIPEPATLAIIGLGLAGLGWARRRK